MENGHRLVARLNPATAGLSTHKVTYIMAVAAYLFEVFLYGGYMVLFPICVLLLLKNKLALKWPFLASAIIMFAISTASIGMSIYNLLCSLDGRESEVPLSTIQSRFLFYAINNIIADALMIYRCFVVWSHSKLIIALPVLLLISSSACGLVFAGAPQTNVALRDKIYIYLWMTMALNIFVTLLTAFRIWWMAHQVSKILGPGLARKYYSAIAIIVESGAIYSLYVLLDLVVKSVILDIGLAQVVGLVPTLILVQVGLKRQTQDVETTVTLAHGESTNAPVLQHDQSCGSVV